MCGGQQLEKWHSLSVKRKEYNPESIKPQDNFKVTLSKAKFSSDEIMTKNCV